MTDEADLCALSASESARLIAGRQVTARELMEAVIRRAEAVQPSANAFTIICANAAREAADAADRAVAGGEPLGALHGVPFTVKDMIDVAGLPITWGSRMFRERVPADDAVAVARLKAAGAIVLGITTMPECGPRATTDSLLYGITRNPWDLDRTPGGSSGGAAAALATGCGAMALGTDAAGSVRVPASCCNVVGLKTTLGLIPNPTAVDLFGTVAGVGVMTRTVADAAFMLSEVGGPDPRDPWSRTGARMDYREVARPTGDMAGTRIAWAPLVGNEEVDAEVRAGCEGSLEALSKLGAEVDEIELDLSSCADVLVVVVGSMLHSLYASKLEKYGDQVDRWVRESVEQGGKWSASQRAAALAERTRLFRKVERVFATYDLIVTPTLTAPPLGVDHYAGDPVTINGRALRSPRYDWFPYCHPFNYTGHPAISVPSGRTSEGLPVGLQIAGPWCAEGRILRAAAELEAARPWDDAWPPLLDRLARDAEGP